MKAAAIFPKICTASPFVALFYGYIKNLCDVVNLYLPICRMRTRNSSLDTANLFLIFNL